MSRILRAVVVTNQGHPEWEGVVIAVEMFSWHETREDALACEDLGCLGRHRHATIGEFEFDFDLRRVLIGGQAREDMAFQPIPAADLAKFNADFGAYYAS